MSPIKVPPKSAAEAIEGNLAESEVVDYKLMLSPKGFVKQISAMANTHGGLIIIGVEQVAGFGTPKVPVAGVSNPDDDQRNLARQIKNQLSPNPTDVKRVEYQGKTLIEVHIAKEPCILWENDAPSFNVRVDSGTEPMKRVEIEKMLQLNREVTGSITPVSITLSERDVSVNIKITVTNLTDAPQSVTGLTLSIEAATSTRGLLPAHLFAPIPQGYRKEPGSIVPFDVPAGHTVIRHITAKGDPILGQLEHVALSGSLKLGTNKVKLHQVFANLLNRVKQGSGAIGYNLAEIDEPIPKPEAFASELSPVVPTPLLTAVLQPCASPREMASVAPYSVWIVLQNSGKISAKEVRVRIAHTENRVVAQGAIQDWRDPIGSSGTLNPRLLEATKSIHADERIPVFSVAFRDEEPEALTFDVQIWCLDQPTTRWHLEIPRKRLADHTPIPFNIVE